jgi:hypothetical protein
MKLLRFWAKSDEVLDNMLARQDTLRKMTMTEEKAPPDTPFLAVTPEDERWDILYQLLASMADDLAEIKMELKGARLSHR